MWEWILGKLGIGGAVAGSIGIDLGPWLDVITSIVGTFALIATRTANTSDDKIADILVKIIHFLGGNFGKAKNAGAV
jgi:hypothetical protein